VAVNAARRAGARIAVTGVGASSEIARSFLRAELVGVRLVEPGQPDASAAEDALRETDMLVLVADGTETAEDGRAKALAGAARERGILIAAIVVSPDGVLGRSPLLAALRDAADMIMIVRDGADVHAVIAALR
jgi:cell division GTPase FtsZ